MQILELLPRASTSFGLPKTGKVRGLGCEPELLNVNDSYQFVEDLKLDIIFIDQELKHAQGETRRLQPSCLFQCSLTKHSRTPTPPFDTRLVCF